MSWRENKIIRSADKMLDRTDKAAISTLASIALMYHGLRGTLPENDVKAYQKIVKDQAKREDDFKRRNMTPERREEHKKLIDDYNNAQGTDIAKQLGRRIYDTVTHPTEIDIPTEIGNSINPLNYVPVGRALRPAGRLIQSTRPNSGITAATSSIINATGESLKPVASFNTITRHAAGQMTKRSILQNTGKEAEQSTYTDEELALLKAAKMNK